MSKLTERLIQASLILFLLWFGWDLVARSVVTQVTLANRAASAEQRLAECGKK